MNCAADAIFFNGSIHTMDEADSIVDAIAVKDGIIHALGSFADILQYKADMTKMVDLKGRTVIPGLIDSHSHFFTSGLCELQEPLFMPQSVEELLEGVKERVACLPQGKGLHLKNIYPTRLREYRYPTIDELDQAAPDNPVFADGAFAGQANSLAVGIIGLSDSRVMKDRKGKPTGIIAQPFELAQKLQPSVLYTIEDYTVALEKMQEQYNRFGITSVIDGSTDELSIKAANYLYSRGKLNVRLAYTSLVGSEGEVAESKHVLESIIETPKQWGKLCFTKIMLDGGILTGTAYMREPYEDKIGVFGISIPEYKGIVNYDSDKLIKIIAAVDREKLQMTAHSIGDAATDILLEAYEKYNETKSITEKRFSIIHCDFTDERVLEKIRTLGIMVLFQPAWHFKDAGVLQKVLSSRTMNSFMPYRSYVDMGIIAAGGSDHMVKYDSMLSQNPYNPFMALYNMVTRKTAEGTAVLEDQKVTREQALRMYTYSGAYTTYDESSRGRITEGMDADFAVLTKDYFNCPVEEIPYLESELTVVGGRVVYGKIDNKSA